MKRIALLVMFVFYYSFHLFSQSPQLISYQAVANDGQGSPLVKQTINVEFKIVNETPDGQVLYSENHPDTPTNEFGFLICRLGAVLFCPGIWKLLIGAAALISFLLE